MAIVHRRGNFAAVETRTHVHTFEVSGAIQRASTVSNTFPLRAWGDDPIRIGDVEIVPLGDNNRMPLDLRDILEDNHIAPGVLSRKRKLLWGQGPALYYLDYSSGAPERKWAEDREILDWLDNWDFEDYLDRVFVDYISSNGYVTKTIRNRAPRIGGEGRINSLEHVGIEKARMEWPKDGVNVKNILVGDFENPNRYGLKKFPVFDKKQPFLAQRAIIFVHDYSYARGFAFVPAYYGALNWIKRSSDIPKVLESLTNNSLQIKWHIKSPREYWDVKREHLKDQCTKKGVAYEEKLLEDLKDEMFSQLGDMLSGVDNVGKFFESEFVINQYGKMEGWEIEAVDMKVKDFIDAQLNIAKRADFEVASGLGLSPSLSNLSMDGNLSSGSEQLYALKLYDATDIEIPERHVTKAINLAIKANFPNKNLKLGFYHKIVKKEEDVSPEARVTNNT